MDRYLVLTADDDIIEVLSEVFAYISVVIDECYDQVAQQTIIPIDDRLEITFRDILLDAYNKVIDALIESDEIDGIIDTEAKKLARIYRKRFEKSNE